MRPILAVAVASVALSVAASAQAQEAGNILGVIASQFQALGQGIGRGAAGGDDIYVYTVGKAPLDPALIQAWQTHNPDFLMTAQGTSEKAVEAVRKRDAIIVRLRDAVTKLGGTIEISDATIAPEGFVAATGLQFMGRTPAADAADEKSGKPPQWVATSNVKLISPSAEKLPELLDALRAAGVADLHPDPDAANYLHRYYDSWSFTATSKIGDATWGAANADAIASATIQAKALAAASGRELGPVNQITYLVRSTDGKQAFVAVTARFHLNPAH